MRWASSFVYPTLPGSGNFVRMVDLYPGAGDLYLSLSTTQLEEANPYSALSYVWGDSTEKLMLFLDGHPYLVTQSLFVALRHIRARFARTEALRLWVDAVCINQDDLMERNRQVQVMGDIYKRAERVILWWGAEDEESSIAMNTLQAFGTGKVVAGDFGTWDMLPELKLNTSRPWVAISKLFQRPVWRRAWILQEIVFASQIVILCGEYALDWEVFQTTYDEWTKFLLPTNPRVLDHFSVELGNAVSGHGIQAADSALILRRAYQNRGFTIPALEILYATLQIDATDPRDKIFSIFNIAVASRDIIIDYALSTRDFYVHFAKEQAPVWGIDKVMVFAGSGILSEDCRTCQLPSWCPDWKTLVKTNLDPGYFGYIREGVWLAPYSVAMKFGRKYKIFQN